MSEELGGKGSEGYNAVKRMYDDNYKVLKSYATAAEKLKVGDYVEAPTTMGVTVRGTIDEMSMKATSKGEPNPSATIHIRIDRSAPIDTGFAPGSAFRFSSFTHASVSDYSKIKKVKK